MGSNLAQRDESLPAAVLDNPVAHVLDTFDPKKYNLVTPVCAIDQLPPMTRVSVQIVTIDQEKDTYPLPGQSNVGIGKNALNRVAAAANVSWEPERSGQVDDWNDPYRVKYRAVGSLTDFNGRPRTIFGEKEIDLRGEPGDPDSFGKDTAEIVRIAEKSRGNRDPWNQIRQQRQHILSLAETKAKNRALREALSIPQGMSKADVARPWVVPSLVPDYDTADPVIKRMLVAQRLGMQGALYGGGDAPALPQSGHVTEGPAEAFEAEPVDEPADITETFEEAIEEDPFADAATPSPLPIPDDVITQCPTSDSTRFEKLEWINVMARRALEVFGEDRSESVFQKHATGIDWLKVSIPDVEAIYHAIVADLKGGA